MNRLLLSVSAIAALIGFASCGSSTSVPGSESDGNWIKKAGFPGIARGYAVSFTINDSAYIGTGYGEGTYNKDLKDFWKYDPSTDAWTQKADLPTNALGRRQAVAFSVGGKGYVGMGSNYATQLATGGGLSGYLYDFYEYDPTTNAWTQKADFPHTTSARVQAVGFGLNNYGYVGTGKDSLGNSYSDLYRFDPTSNTWLAQSYIPGDKRYGAVAFTYNNKGYVVTGANSSGYTSDFYSFDGTSWTKLTSIANVLTNESYDDAYTTIQRKDAVAFVVGNFAYLATGYSSSGFNSKTWAYNFTTNRWEVRTPYKQTARQGAVGFALKNLGYVTTGNSSSSTPYDNLSQFDPTATYVENDDIYN